MSAETSEELAEALGRAFPQLAIVRERQGESRSILVGGAVRDLLLGRGLGDIDLVIEGDACWAGARLGADVVQHERFCTARTRLGEHEIDIAAARTETYPRPGALPK